MLKKLSPSSRAVIKTILLFAGLAIGTFVFFRVSSVINYKKDCAAVGESAVKLLYDFSSVEQLDYNMYDLQQITTPAVFNQLSIDNTDRALNTYLKFKQKAVSVEVLKSTDTYVMYTLHTDSLSEGRNFVFFFSINNEGLIDWVREVETIDFIQDSN